MEIDYSVLEPSAVTVKVIEYYPTVVVARDADLHAIEVSFILGHEGYVIPVIKVVTA